MFHFRIWYLGCWNHLITKTFNSLSKPKSTTLHSLFCEGQKSKLIEDLVTKLETAKKHKILKQMKDLPSCCCCLIEVDPNDSDIWNPMVFYIDCQIKQRVCHASAWNKPVFPVHHCHYFTWTLVTAWMQFVLVARWSVFMHQYNRQHIQTNDNNQVWNEYALQLAKFSEI